MKHPALRAFGPSLLAVALSASTQAQPSLVITPVGDDLSGNGNTVVGLIYDSSVQEYVPHTWTRGTGFVRIPGAYASSTGVFCSTDASVLTMGADNSADWGELNCFNGYYWSQADADAGFTLGQPRPPSLPCGIPSITHRWTQAAGWVNAGSLPRMLDGATGRYFGGTRCDFDINSPNDISGNGRYIVGGAWNAPITSPSGGPGFGLCGGFDAFIYDSQTGSFQGLPSSNGTARADRVNADGTVVTGYDLDPAQSMRRTSVWRNGAQTIIDPYFGSKDNAGVNAAGNMIASGASTDFVAATFPGEVGVRLVRWTWQSGVWVPENLGRPVAFPDPASGVQIAFSDLWVTGMSDDGNTIIGTAQYGVAPPSIGGLRRPFIWRPSINGGVPIDLESYVNAAGAPNPLFGSGFGMTYTPAISADGNAILVQIADQRNTCPPGFMAPRSLNTGHFGVMYLNGAAIACEPPRIALSPGNWVQDYDIRLGAVLNVFVSGSWPLTYQWQREVPGQPGTWVNLTDACAGFVESDILPWAYEGTLTRQLRIGTGEGGADRAGRYRVIVSNSCGSVTSDAGTVTFISGACCIPATACLVQYQDACVDLGGTWQGVGTACSPVDACQVQSGACCAGATCSVQPSSACTGTAMLFAGANTVCGTFAANPTTPCCRADFNHVGDVSVQDIFDFLNAYFNQDPLADINGGGTSVQDIFDFLSAYFAGC